MNESSIFGVGLSHDAIMGIILFGGLIVIVLLIIVGIGAHTWLTSRQEAHRAELEATLKRDMLDRGLSVDDIERLLRASAESPKQLAKADADVVGDIGGYLGVCQAEPEIIEEVFAMVRDADSATRLAMLSAVRQMHDDAGGQITDVQIRAVVRALARPARPSTESVSLPEDMPPLTSAASRISDAFRASERPG